ncbi:Chaperone protein dnaJ 49 [Zostera marina]|uniref:Chaperone protein dnaJ 49 n=1 Tax=Zostera marina TaxID=29655 RepID=A0A0K9PK91_ZOSMR|nr:Chaperone protein dnaJ 49 [Zostera marina]
MDGNKDAAIRCLQIGKEALEVGDRERAIRFLTKAGRLDPSLQVDDLLASTKGEGKQNDESTQSGESPQNKKGSHGPSLTRRVPPSSASSVTSDSTKAYTEEQILIVRKIKKVKDYYQVLGLERNCTTEDMRKAYRKLSLKVHPDKNKAPGAEEAFKALSKAFQCLSNEESKQRYDLVGSDEPVQHVRRSARNSGFGYNGFYEGEVDAEEIFRNFFFGSMAPANFRHFRTAGTAEPRVHREMHPSSGTNLRMLLQVLPVLVLILLNFIPSTEPPYGLSWSHTHNYRLDTQRGVPFYVNQGKFERDYPPNSVDRIRLEEKIEREYVSIVSQTCRVELQRRRWGYENKTPHCDMLQKYKAAVDSSA